MIYRADVIVLAGFNILYLSGFGPLNHCFPNNNIVIKTCHIDNVFVYVLHMQEIKFKMSVLDSEDNALGVFDVAFVLARELCY